jgi:hypothetical protein
VTGKQPPEFGAYNEHSYWVETFIGEQHLFGKVKGINHNGGASVHTHPICQKHPKVEREVCDDEDNSQRHHYSCAPDP